MIRKIIIGTNPKDAMAYYLGMKVKDSIVSAIEVDERILHTTARVEYVIFLTGPEGTMPWKRVSGMPVILEYDCDF